MATQAAQLHTGTLVKLKSGGPIMTVDGFVSGQVVCVWFDKQEEFKTIKVFPGALNKTSSDEENEDGQA